MPEPLPDYRTWTDAELDAAVAAIQQVKQDRAIVAQEGFNLTLLEQERANAQARIARVRADAAAARERLGLPASPTDDPAEEA